MKRTFSIIVAAMLLFAALIAFTPLSPKATAQSATKKQLYNVSIQRYKTETEYEYYDFVKNVMNPLYVKAGLKERAAWRADRGTRNEIIYFVPIESFAATHDYIREALGNEEVVRLFWQKHSRFIESSTILTIEAMPDLSWTNPKFSGQPQLALMRWQTVAYGRSTEYEDFFKTLEIPARRKTAEQSNMIGQWRFRLRFGGDVYRYLMFRPMASYAEQDAGGTKGLGQILGATEYQKLLDKLPKGVILQDEAYLLRYRADLSITPQTNTAEKK